MGPPDQDALPLPKSCAGPGSSSPSLLTTAPPWYGGPDAPGPSAPWPMCGCSCRSSVMATSDHPGSSGLPKLPTRRPRQDHGSGAVCARLLGGECAAQPDSLGPARDAILDTHGESSAPPSPWLGPPP